MGLSIPELPAHAVYREHARHLEAGHDRVLIAKQVALLEADDRAQDTYFEKHRQRFRHGRLYIARARRERCVTAIFVDTSRPDGEVSSREASPEIIRVIELRSAF